MRKTYTLAFVAAVLGGIAVSSGFVGLSHASETGTDDPPTARGRVFVPPSRPVVKPAPQAQPQPQARPPVASRPVFSAPPQRTAPGEQAGRGGGRGPEQGQPRRGAEEPRRYESRRGRDDDRRRYVYRGAGIAAGATIIGGILAYRSYSYANRDTVYARCDRNFPDFDYETGTFVNEDGDRELCPYLEY